jgi:hypothetical protein
MRSFLKLLFVASLILAFANVTVASNGHGTPDNQPPADETVCDIYSGAAYGLCNAYCEAMDCDNPNVHASTAGCANVRANFMRKTGSDLPCEAGIIE